MMGRLRENRFLEDDRGTLSASYGPFVLKSAFQPIFGRDEHGRFYIDAFEALIRASRANQPVSPGHFFSLVEKQDALAVDTLCRELHILNMGRLGRKNARLFINFNPGIFESTAVIDREVEQMLDVTRRAGLRPGRIICEMTEHGGGDDATLVRLVNGLRASLFKIAVDDFGADDSDISRVDGLNPDIIKFDAAWVRRYTDTSAGKSLLGVMVSQFIDRGITVLFEGLEEDEQVDFCQEIGVQLMQGYALARPEIVPTTFNARFPEETDNQEKSRRNGAPLVRTSAVQAGDLTWSVRAGGSVPLGSPRRNAVFGRRTR